MIRESDALKRVWFCVEQVAPIDTTVLIAEKTFQTTKLDELAREHIMRVLEQAKWRIEGPKGAALVLGLHPSTVRAHACLSRVFEKKMAQEPPGQSKKIKIKMSKTKAAICHCR